jgi:UDP-N-acetylmuramyl tripeptide synthase
VKLLEILKAIDPICVNAFGAERNQKEGHAPCAMPPADLIDMDVDSIHYRAQEVLPGGMFVAIKGQTADGHDFMHQALQKGALAVVTQKEPPQPYLNQCLAQAVQTQPIIIRVSDTRKAMADLAARFYGDPSEDMTLIGITGQW